MPKKIDASLKEWAVRMLRDHRQDYPSDTALAEAVATKVGVGRETVAGPAEGQVSVRKSNFRCH
jgi:hypothetical protein